MFISIEGALVIVLICCSAWCNLSILEIVCSFSSCSCHWKTFVFLVFTDLSPFFVFFRLLSLILLFAVVGCTQAPRQLINRLSALALLLVVLPCSMNTVIRSGSSCCPTSAMAKAQEDAMEMIRRSLMLRAKYRMPEKCHIRVSI